ncbi:MAG: class I SAM-dependent methyltransferase [Asgard group archaeon]|nr:class I SAM-dependent methyltransferase [Asgard group archaeon]
MNDRNTFYNDNKKMWDEFTILHKDSETYKTKEFLEGKSTLSKIELGEIGDLVKGKALLHLQCHFGLDTLSWAREGAIVTGVDMSEESIKLARSLADKTNLEANFIQSNIYDLPQALDEKFDIVFTSYGVLCWLDDLDKWAKVIAHFLKPGALFYIAEFHRFTWVFDWDAKDDFALKRSYFHDSSPLTYTIEGSYAKTEKRTKEKVTGHEWAHSMSDVINALINAGLIIKQMNEFPYTTFQSFPFLKQSDDGLWYYDNPKIQLPLTFSIMAEKKK